MADPAGVDVLHITSAAQLHEAVTKHAPDANVLVMAAAVADFRPPSRLRLKIMKQPGVQEAPAIELVSHDAALPGAVH
ncbi:MAG: phosphopantothenoylcysteine decarboxylase [Micropruina glycogenica]